MSDAGKAVYGVLSGDAAFGLLVANDRIFPNLGKHDAGRPYVVYTVVDDTPLQVVGGDTGGSHARVQIDCYGEGYDSVHAVKAAVRNALDGYTGTSNGVVVKSSVLLEQADGYEPDTELHRVRMDFSIRT